MKTQKHKHRKQVNQIKGRKQRIHRSKSTYKNTESSVNSYRKQHQRNKKITSTNKNRQIGPRYIEKKKKRDLQREKQKKVRWGRHR